MIKSQNLKVNVKSNLYCQNNKYIWKNKFDMHTIFDWKPFTKFVISMFDQN